MVSICEGCKRSFTTLKGLNIHKASCKIIVPRKINLENDVINFDITTQNGNIVETNAILSSDEIIVEHDLSNKPYLPEINIFVTIKSQDEHLWGHMPFSSLLTQVTTIYDEIAFYHKNLFKVPSGKGGKMFIEELTFWLQHFNKRTKLNEIAMKCFMILPTLMLQKPSPRSKAKEHSESLVRRITLWRKGDIGELMREIRHIQSKINTSKKQRTVEDISRIFAKLIMEGKVSAAIKFLDRESSGVLQCSESVLKELKEKHPDESSVKDNSLLYGPLKIIPECFFDSIDEISIFNSASRTKGSAGPSGMDADLYRRVLCSKSFGSSCKTLREEIATFTKNIATKSYHPDLIQSYIACRLIPLDKNPGVRPIGIGEVLRRIVGKTISHHCQKEIKEAAGPLQTCAGHGAGAEAEIHAMREIFQQEDTDAVLLIDARNAFNCLNRSVALHNIQITCPILAMYLINTYRKPAKLIIYGGETILSREGTTSGGSPCHAMVLP